MSHSTRHDRLEETVAFTPVDPSARLLAALAALPPDGDLADGLYAVVSAVAEGVDDVAVGVSVRDEGSEPVVVRHGQPHTGPRASHASRLFADWAFEEVLPAGSAGVTVHVASGAPIDAELRRGAEQLCQAVDALVRRHRHTREMRRELDEAAAMRDRAVQSDKLAGLGRMAASIVHELNNPLTSIVAYASWLAKRWERADADPEERERLVRIGEAATRVLAYTRDLVAYSRPSAARPSSLSVNDVVERALSFCDHFVEEGHVTVARSLGEVPAVRGLHGPLTQVVVNLVTNARQALGEGGGSIEIGTRLSADGRWVEIHVSDDGSGIPRDALERVFDPYFTTRGESGGTGLGLDIVQTIVSSHGGRVRAAANEPRGARFVVELPVARRD